MNLRTLGTGSYAARRFTTVTNNRNVKGNGDTMNTITEKQVKFLNDLSAKYAITIDMGKVTTKKLASDKISQILKAIESGIIKERIIKFVPMLEIIEDDPSHINTDYDAEADYANQGALQDPTDFYETIDNILDEKGLGVHGYITLYGKPYALTHSADPFDENNYTCSKDYYRATAYLTRPGEDLQEFYRELEEGLSVARPKVDMALFEINDIVVDKPVDDSKVIASMAKELQAAYAKIAELSKTKKKSSKK
jgi:hypothetical protein